MPNEKLQAGKRYLRAKFDSSTINAEKRTVDVVFATENEVLMSNWSVGLFREILVCEKGAGDLTRLNSGGPLVDTHNTYSVRNSLGVVDRAWFDNNVGRATIRFSKRADVEPIWQDVADGILTGVSVGYNVYTYEITEETGKLPLYRATNWEACEISLALVQADIGSGVGRSQTDATAAMHEVTLIRNINNVTMSKPKGAQENEQTNTNAEGAAAEGQQHQPAATAEGGAPETGTRAAGNAVAEERKRIFEIQKMCRSLNITDENFIAELVGDESKPGLGLNEARVKIIDKTAEMNKGNQTQTQNAGITVRADEADKRRNIGVIGLCLRSGQFKESDFKPEEVNAARDFRHVTLLDIARESLVRSGEYTWNTVMSLHPMEVAKRAITSSTSDFPVMLEGTNRRTLLAAYNTVADTWKKFCAIGSVGDFRDYKRVRQDALAGTLDLVPENAEYKNKPLPDGSQETVNVATYGNTINLSRKMIINDDLGGFTGMAAKLGRVAARTIETAVYALLTSNPTMSDGNALFSSQHGNLAGSGANITIALLDAARVAMASHRDAAGEYIDNIRPSILLINPTWAGQAKIYNNAQFDTDVTSKFQVPNRVAGLFNSIIDTQRISGNAWYTFADPSIEPVIEVNFLNGVQEPYLESQQAFHVDGLEWKVRLDYGVDAVGWVGAYKNPGA